ncbi:hypothetical protein FFT09_10310 [Saccharomonospora piscinae]|uniref:hypothetical protein n=1 Tax=Saccharomonospora piscinae TaxID=687388 RepID=UPI001106C717|nr:hypothetical protein [Saccharomonospora piscinae]TLW93745.1 hypothetical protein FFT09_10310 [Saccharomonospora piscinae]
MAPPRRRVPGSQPPSPTRRPRVAGSRTPSPAKRAARPESPTEQAESTEATESAEATKSAESGKSTEPAERVEPTEQSDQAESAEPTGEAEQAEPTESADSGDRSRGSRLRGLREPGYPLLAALVVAALVFGGLAVFFESRHSAATEGSANQALVDVAATAEVEQAMSDAAERLFSVDFNDIEKTQRAADELLADDDVRSTYDALMGDYRTLASEQKAVVTTTAVRSAVEVLGDDRARVMVYVDQTATRSGAEESQGGDAAMWFETERRDGAWKVVNMDVYSADQRQPPPAGQSSGARPAPPGNGSAPSSSQAGEPTEGN